MIDTLKKMFARDLAKLKTEISQYKNEPNIWRTDRAITNPAGNLCLHLVSNLNAYVGAIIGGTNYMRHRELEFSLKDIAREELFRMIENTIAVVAISLDKISEADLNAEYPMQVFDAKTTTGYMLVHLASHLAYHLGQVNYHRRLLDN